MKAPRHTTAVHAGGELGPSNWRDAAEVLRRHANIFDAFAEELAAKLPQIPADNPPRCPVIFDGADASLPRYRCRRPIGHPDKYHAADPLELRYGVRSFVWTDD